MKSTKSSIAHTIKVATLPTHDMAFVCSDDKLKKMDIEGLLDTTGELDGLKLGLTLGNADLI